jgi:hypothetical protein
MDTTDKNDQIPLVKVEFFTTDKALLDTAELHPRPAKAHIPDWFRNMPSASKLNSEEDGTTSEYKVHKTVQQCPSFPDYFSQGYVLPLWTDVIIKYDKDRDYYEYRLAGEQYKIQSHGNGQFLDWVDSSFLGKKSEFIFKFVSPWEVRTPPGYSVLQLPMFYHFNDQFSILPGVIDTDIFHEINQQVVYHGEGKELFIPRGTPLVQYIPFKRERFEYSVELEDEEMKDAMAKNRLLIASKFNGAYSHMRRERDKWPKDRCPYGHNE